jgi:SPW repeat
MATHNPRTLIRMASSINVLLGAFLIMVPRLLHYTAWDVAATYNSMVVGAAILICALIRIVHPGSSSAFGIANIALGAWLVISSSMFEDASPASGWLSLGAGTAVIILATWGTNLITGPTLDRRA